MPMATEMPNASMTEPAGHERLLIGDEVDDELRDGECPRHAQQAADAGEDDRLDQELLGDVPPLGAQGPADADLAGPLGHRRQHDVHDADAADQERDRGDGSQDDAELAGRLSGPATSRS